MQSVTYHSAYGFLCYMINKGIKYFCKDDISLIENYDKAISDKEQTWQCHHRRELETPRKELIKIGEYYNRPAEELVFLTKSEHNALHNTLKFKGKTLSDETKIKISVALKGKPAWNKGKNLSEDHKQKLSEATKYKNIGSHWFNNGIKTVFVKECPEGFVKGRLKKAI